MVTVSSTLARYMRSLGGKVRVIPNGVDTELFRPGSVEEKAFLKTLFGLRPDEPLILYAGRIETPKGN